MTGIEEIIKRSRARGGFSAKGSFTLASDKARVKVSEFALPDPYLYCIEYIQAAVALKATYLDAAVDDATFILSISGVRFTRENLARMFEFLLNDQQLDSVRAHRCLAVGTSAALSLPNAEVVIESGDGTLDGSARFECNGIHREATIGTPDVPIAGTFIKVKHASRANALNDTFIEEDRILARCRFLPVTLVLNGEMPFGYSFSRAIQLPMYPHHLGFDEPDLYGGLAVDDGSSAHVLEGVRLLTDGVEISSISPPFTALKPLPPVLGVAPMRKIEIVGAVFYDRLRKTASRYEIVQDIRIDELLERLKPFVNELLIKAGISEEERLLYLLDKEPPDFDAWGSPYRMRIQTEPFIVTGIFKLSPDIDESPGLRLNVVYATKNKTLKSIQFLPLGFPMPVRGRIIFKGNCLGALRLIRYGDEGYSLDGAVSLTPEMERRIADAVQNEFESLRRHIKSQLEQRQALHKRKPGPPKEAPAAADNTTTTAREIPADTTKQVPPVSVETKPQAAEAQVDSEPESNASSRGMPTPREIREKLGACDNESAIQIEICNFLRRILVFDPDCKNFFDRSVKHSVFAKAVPMKASAAWVDTARRPIDGKFDSPIYVNLSHAHIRKWFDEAPSNPTALYAAAMLIRVEVAFQRHTETAFREAPGTDSGLAQAILSVL